MITFERLRWASFTHSAVYTALLVSWAVPGMHPEEFVFGLAHGLGWIAMSLTCLWAVRHRVIGMRLGVAVAVIGGIGPFVGSIEFVREQRRRNRSVKPG